MLEALSRIQFALTIGFHYLFVPASIGLILFVAIFETAHFSSRKGEYKALSNFFSEIFLVVYVVGIATGLTMPIQFGTNWSKYAVFMGDVFGSPLAFEALIAFFLESTFAGIWIFKRDKIGRGLRLLTVWLIFLGTSISAIWILTANSFMQHPVGFALSPDRSKVILSDFGQVLGNPYLWWMFFHNHAAAFLIGAFIVLAVSANLMGRRGPEPMLRKSVAAALIVAVVASVSLPIVGDLYGRYLASVQPLKASLMLGQVVPSTEGGLKPAATSGASLSIDLSSLPELPNAVLVRVCFLAMVALGAVFIVFVILFAIRRGAFWESPASRRAAAALVPLGYAAVACGWIVAEAGRFPWIVYGLMPVREALSKVPVASVVFSLCLMVVLYALLAAVAITLIRRIIKKGPAALSGPEEDSHAAA